MLNLVAYSSFNDVALRDIGLLLATLTLGRFPAVYDRSRHRPGTSGARPEAGGPS